jgi:hypothetical protein
MQDKSQHKTWTPSKNYIFTKDKHKKAIENLEQKVRTALRVRWGKDFALEDWEERYTKPPRDREDEDTEDENSEEDSGDEAGSDEDGKFESSDYGTFSSDGFDGYLYSDSE